MKTTTKKFEKKQIQKVRQIAENAIKKYNLIQDGDHILVGVSGGKDSLALLEILATRTYFANEKFKLSAAHIEVENLAYEIDHDFLNKFCEQWNIPVYYRKFELDFEKTNKTPCFICSWKRRAILFELTKQIGCNKLALGHHKDDAIETMLLNLFYHSSISSLPPKMKMFENRIELIRPLMYLTDAQLKTFAQIQNYPHEKKICPHDKNTQRFKIKQLLQKLEKENSEIKNNIFNAMGNIYPDYLPFFNENKS